MTSAARSVPVVRVPYERFELSCGAVLLVSPRPGAPVTAAQIHVRGSHSLDAPGLEGVSYLTGALLDQGTSKHSEEELAARVETAGGSLVGDASGLSGNIAGPHWKRLCETMAEIVTDPVFPADRVARQRQRLLDRLLLERDDPRTQADKRFRKLVYGDHWIGRPAYGSLESVPEIQRRHLRAHHRKNWVARRAVISVCGDVEPEAVRRLWNRRLSEWKPGQSLEPTQHDFPRKAVRIDAYRRERQQVHVYLGHLGIVRRDPDYAPLVVMDHVLGTGPGFTNRISRRLRDELGLAYTVHADISASAGVLPGIFTAYIGTSPEHVSTAVQGFREEIHRIQREPVDADELQIAKDYLVGAFALGFQRASRRASYLISAERHGFPADNLERLPREFAAVTREDVQRVAQKHLSPESCCLAAAGPVTKKELRAALEGDG